MPAAHYAVRVSASIRLSPERVTLAWPAVPCRNYEVFRRDFGAKRWPSRPRCVLDGKATACVDSGLLPGRVYEYKIMRNGKGYTGYGYACAALEAPLPDERGGIVLVVERRASRELAAEVARLRRDLVGDGWTVITHAVSRTASPPEVKALIKSDYRAAPERVKAVLLLGQVPVPYSGSIKPDGHGDHRGAWPADIYYGDMTGLWTDRSVRRVQKDKRNTNVPGDGKFDQSKVAPPRPELQVGRIDLHGMPQFKTGEMQLLRRYLDKDHRYRHGQLAFVNRALVRDKFGEFRGEAFAASAWRGFAPLVGAAAIRTGRWVSTQRRHCLLLGYGCGPGGHTGCAGVGSTADFAATDPRVLFTFLFGSYFGDWDCENAFLRSPLATRHGGLVCGWSGRPHWLMHHLGVGQTIGYCALRTQQNDARRDYPGCGKGVNGVHVALMGDPTLRLYPVRPPTALRAVAGASVRLRWRPSPDAKILGYHVYRSASIAGTFERLTARAVQATGFADGAPLAGRAWYMVRAVRRQSGPSGVFLNASQGVFAVVGQEE